ncbi:DUF1800 domain-containing protein [Sphingosinithalassobacter portus]|uniref:DUF1800 domain-containing protein n=1 Tax=Stakelama portus TaxID=2676234 RepID=UPI001876C4B6|nr:DUF1800 domain-containing protein [Sphingosinithalassobacter portus]
MGAVSVALNRFGYGARPEEALPEAPRKWLRDQLDRYDPSPRIIADQPPTRDAAALLADYNRQTRMARQDAAASPMPAADTASDADPVREARRRAGQQMRQFYIGAVAARTQATLSTPAPFVERLVHFWANHFAISADKLTVTGFAGAFEFEAIRPHVLGSFGDMLHAVERHAAMLLYLDQAQSVGPASRAGIAARRNGRNIGLNENLAREILELHTLGVRSVYTQQDVGELARAMTGWTVAGLGRGAGRRAGAGQAVPGSFLFADRLHEPGTRTLLGKNFAQAGEAQTGAILDMLATHPATARHVATKLARHFAGDHPPEPLVARLEHNFLETGGNLPELYRVLIAAPECWGDAPVKFRTPWEWTVGAYRALGMRDVAQPRALVNQFVQLAQPVWRPGAPAGFDDIAASWNGPDSLLRRVELAERFAARSRDRIDPRARAAKLFPDALSAATQQAIARAESPGQGVALLLVAPEFLRR